jgi:hypothetical protein
MIAVLVVIGLFVFVLATYATASQKAAPSGLPGYNGHTLTTATGKSRLPARKPVETYDFSQSVNADAHEVVYKVSVLQSGCHSIGTTYKMPNGTAQKDVSACSNSTTVTIDSRTAQRGDFLYLSVQNDENFTTISCQIFVDDILTYETKSTGEYVIASCSGKL